MPRFRLPRLTREDFDRFGPLDTSPATDDEIALVLTGGGARGAYQVGVLRSLARHYPELRFPIITGVSAGAVNAVGLASHHGTVRQAVDELTGLWNELTIDKVIKADWGHLAWGMARWGARLVSGGLLPAPEVKGLLDTRPLRSYLTETMAAIDGELTGIDYNLHRGVLKAVAVSTTSYTTGQHVVFVQGRDIQEWRRPYRRGMQTRLRVDHVMASSALPGFFPAIRIRDHWYGDGGVRLTAPLSPALHLGARRIVAVSTRFEGTQEEGDAPQVSGYPPPAQLLGVLTRALFLDTLHQDERRLRRLNEFVTAVPEQHRKGLRPVQFHVIRPSRDLSKIARQFEPKLPRGFRFLTRGMGTTETGSPDILAMMLFEPDFIRALIQLGEADTDRQLDELAGILGTPPTAEAPPGEAGGASASDERAS
jgi:NTE family protein